MIQQEINQLITEALKSKNEIRLTALRMLSSALNYERIEKMHELSKEEELSIVMREAKKRKESAQIYKDAGRNELAEKELAELLVLEEFLPKQLSDKELEVIIEKYVSTIGKDIKNMGQIIGKVVGEVKGQADGVRISSIVKSKLSS